MSTLSRSSHIIQNGYKAFKPRQFHQVSFLAAKRSPKASPRVAAKIRNTSRAPPPAGTTRVQKTYISEECLPPIALLQAGSKSGALPVDPNTAVSVLLRYQELAKKPSAGWERTLCTGKQFFQHLTDILTPFQNLILHQ
jgi:hypothetical protein